MLCSPSCGTIYFQAKVAWMSWLVYGCSFSRLVRGDFLKMRKQDPHTTAHRVVRNWFLLLSRIKSEEGVAVPVILSVVRPEKWDDSQVAFAKRVSHEPCFCQAHCFVQGRLRFLPVPPNPTCARSHIWGFPNHRLCWVRTASGPFSANNFHPPGLCPFPLRNMTGHGQMGGKTYHRWGESKTLTAVIVL